MDHNRHYFGHKAAKDILMLMGENITVHDFKDKLFDGKAILNYLNDMILNVILYYSEIEDGFSLDFKDYMFGYIDELSIIVPTIMKICHTTLIQYTST